MNSSFSLRSLFLLCPLFLQAVAPSQTQAQLSGKYRSAPGTLAMYVYHTGQYHTVPLPADVTMRFSASDPLSMTALIHKPIIGDTAENFDYGIVNYFPMVVTGTSTDGRTFRGDLLQGSQYMFEWTFSPADSRRIHWDGEVAWMGGRVEVSTIEDAWLNSIGPGDYNEDGTADAADFVVWRKASGQSDRTPIGFLADGDGDGQVDEGDYNLWRSHFGETTRGLPVGLSIPEPATWLLLVLAFLATACAQRTALNRIRA